MKKSGIGNKIILASASPRRRELLTRAKIVFDVVPSQADEDNSIDSDPRDLVLRNALTKAEDVSRRFPNTPVLGADTVVAYGGRVFGKPRDLADAKEMLKILSGNTHSVFTGVAVLVAGKNISEVDAEESRVKFKKLNDSEIDAYLKAVHVLDKAGAYAAQECGEMIIENIEGAFDNVMGLPCALAKNLLDTAQRAMQDDPTFA